jgi:hypothetical protein
MPYCFRRIDLSGSDFAFASALYIKNPAKPGYNKNDMKRFDIEIHEIKLL